MKIETPLNAEIHDEFENLKGMELGTEEYKTTVDGLTKLMDRAIEIEKLKTETSIKAKQAEEDRKDRWVRYGIDAAGIAVPAVITIWGTLKSLKFEEEGTVTTIVGRGFINKLLPKK